MLLAYVVKLNFNQVKLTGAIKITFDFSLTFPLFISFMKLRLGSKVSLSMFYGPVSFKQYTYVSRKHTLDIT